MRQLSILLVFTLFLFGSAPTLGNQRACTLYERLAQAGLLTPPEDPQIRPQFVVRTYLDIARDERDALMADPFAPIHKPGELNPLLGRRGPDDDLMVITGHPNKKTEQVTIFKMGPKAKVPTAYELFTPEEWEILVLMLEDMYTKGNYGMRTLARIWYDDPLQYSKDWYEGVQAKTGDASMNTNDPRYQSPNDALAGGKGLYLWDPAQFLLTAATKDGTIMVCNWQVCALGGNLKDFGLPEDRFKFHFGRFADNPFYHAYASTRMKDNRWMPLDTSGLQDPGGAVSGRLRKQRDTKADKKYDIEPWKKKFDQPGGYNSDSPDDKADPNILYPKPDSVLHPLAWKYLNWLELLELKYPGIRQYTWRFHPDIRTNVEVIP